jgi:hypothetical protein
VQRTHPLKTQHLKLKTFQTIAQCSHPPPYGGA